MKRNFLMAALVLSFSNVYAEDLEHIPTILNAKDIEKKVMPPKGGCDDCKVTNSIASGPLAHPMFSSKPEIPKQVEMLKANVACTAKVNRLEKDSSFYINGGNLKDNKIGGNFQVGFLSQGTISKMWVGQSAFGDLMFVTKVMDGEKVVGYNVTLSYCEMKNSHKDLPSVVSNQRSIDSFQAPYGIVLDDSTSCGYGVVDLAQRTTVVSRRDSKDAYSAPDSHIPTSFTKPKCANSF